jgi:hypothetical protein
MEWTKEVIYLFLGLNCMFILIIVSLYLDFERKIAYKILFVWFHFLEVSKLILGCRIDFNMFGCFSVEFILN